MVAAEMPALWIFVGVILALWHRQIQNKLTVRLLSHPTPVPIFAVRHKPFREFNPLTGAIADTGMTLTVPIHLTLKKVSWSPFIRRFGQVCGRGRN